MKYLEHWIELLNAKIIFLASLVPATMHTASEWPEIVDDGLQIKENIYLYCAFAFIILSIFKRIYEFYLSYKEEKRKKERHDKEMNE